LLIIAQEVILDKVDQLNINSKNNLHIFTLKTNAFPFSSYIITLKTPFSSSLSVCKIVQKTFNKTVFFRKDIMLKFEEIAIAG
jgi:hypothetical protein